MPKKKKKPIKFNSSALGISSMMSNKKMKSCDEENNLTSYKRKKK